MFSAFKKLAGMDGVPRAQEQVKSLKNNSTKEVFDLEERIYSWLSLNGVTPAKTEDVKQDFFENKKREVLAKVIGTKLQVNSNASTAEKDPLSMQSTLQIDCPTSSLASRRRFADKLQSIDLFSGSLTAFEDAGDLSISTPTILQVVSGKKGAGKLASIDLDLPTPFTKTSRKRRHQEIQPSFNGLSESAP